MKTTPVRIIDHLPLPAGIAGLTDGHTIWLNPLLTEAGRRCTLAHELVHLDRGAPPPGLEAKEEHKVDRLAARHLTPTERLVEAVVIHEWSTTRGALAEELDLDLTMLDIRLDAVTKEEQDRINAALDDLGQVA